MKTQTKLKRLLVPVDFSEASLLVLPFAETLASSESIELHLLHADQPSLVYATHSGGGVAPMPTPIPQTRSQLQLKLKDATQLSFTSESRVKRVVVDGPPAEAIVSYAKDNDIDLIVMTTHGKTGLTRLLMGSVAETVVRTSGCPVMTLNAAAANDNEPTK